MGVAIRVNGAEHEVASDERAALLWVLRDELGLASPKYGCGLDQCGACRVLIDGLPTASCTTAVSGLADREVTTLEQLVADGRAAPVVEAMARRNAGQCGYCLPGIVTTLTALCERPGPPPDRDALLRALDDHLCRCGSQPRIVAAACEVLGIDDVPAHGSDDE